MPALATTDDGWLLVAALVTPIAGAFASFVAGGRGGGRVALVSTPIGVAVAAAILGAVLRTDAPLAYRVGGWAPPLGVGLRADGASAALLLTTAVVLAAVAGFAAAEPDAPSERRTASFWVLFHGLWAGLVAAFASNDLFSLYVALEVLTFAAVPLVSLDGRAETVAAALRYLLFALLGSLLYLLGVGLIYGARGVLDLGLLATSAPIEPAVAIAVALMIAGLFAKSAFFPLHAWLPPAHAGAPPVASAMLSALVVKAGFFIALRLVFELLGGSVPEAAAQLLGVLGACAVLHGSVLALRQVRLKLLVAYSTVAQLGYLLLVFPLAHADEALRLQALTGSLVQTLSHALAKAAMFLGVGALAARAGSDRLDDLRAAPPAPILSVIALAVAGASLIGLPPSGGFRAKWLLLDTAVETGQWWWGLVILAGGALSVGYVLRALAPLIDGTGVGQTAPAAGSRTQDAIVLGLAIASLLLGFSALVPPELLLVGRAP